jgi:MFS family permease
MVTSKESYSETRRPRFRWFGLLTTALLFVFGIACQLPVLSVRFPSLDDSGYLFDGVRLVEQGTWMPLGSGPLSGILNGAIYLFFPRDHMLLGYVSLIRRMILLIGITAAAGLAARAVGGKRAGWAAMAVTAVMRPLSTILMVTADSLYAALAGLGFAVILFAWIAEKQNGKRARSGCWIASGLLLGLAALARLDGLLLGVFLIPVLWFFRGRNRTAVRGAAVFAGSFALPVVMYILIYAASTGKWDPQIGQRSYLAFEQGHNFLYTDHYEVVPTPSASDVYGTAAENGNSVLRAIARNPQAFLRRLPLVAANAVRMFYDAYSILGGAMFLFLAAGGAAVLWKSPHRAALGLALLWCLPLLGYALASYRPGFFGMLLPVLLTLVVAGSLPVIANFRALLKTEQVSLLAVWLLVAAAMLGSQLAFMAGQFRGWNAARQAENRYQSWLSELSSQVPHGECVVAFNAADAIYSNHSVYGNWQLFYEVGDPDALRTAMEGSGCRFLVVDPDLQTFAPEFVPVAEKALQWEYTSRDGSRKIYELIH